MRREVMHMSPILSKQQMTEEDIKLQYITPAITAKWDKSMITMETKITDGKINIKGNLVVREKPKKADYVLYLGANQPIAIVEAKDNNHLVSYGLQQSMTYAKMLDVPFAYSSNGDAFYEHDFLTGKEQQIALDDFPSPDDLKARYDQEATKEDLRAYFAAWWQMFKKHPGVYFEATFHNTYEYYDINKISSLVYYEWNTYLLDHPKLYADEDYLTVTHDEETAPDRYVLHQLVLIMEKVPILNLFAAVGLLPWLVIFMLLLNRRRGMREYDPVLLLPIITFLICLTSPDNGNYRYIIPIMFGLPFLFLLVFLPKEGEKNS